MEVQRIHFSTIDSTNAWVKEHAEELDPEKATCVTADVQTSGYGRQNRNWISERGNLHLSLFFTLLPTDPIIPNLAEVFALSCAEVLIRESVPIQIKWPNDLLLNGKKLCGILVETISMQKHFGIVAGVGMNVNASVSTDQPTLSLREWSNEEWDLNELSQRFIAQFFSNIQKPFSKLIALFEELLAYKGETIICKTGDISVQGTLLGVSKNGGVRVQLGDDSISEILSGDIQHLRPS